MRTLSLLSALVLGACNGGGDSDDIDVSGELAGLPFEPPTVVFDRYGPGPQDTAAPDPAQLGLVLADGEELCPLLGALFHYTWLRCESACAGLYAQQALWPEGDLRVLWVELTAEDGFEGTYALSAAGGPGLFSADYRLLDLEALAELDEAGCLKTCQADYGFLQVDQGAANFGEVIIEAHGDDALEGRLDLLFDQGSAEAEFVAPRCDMGMHAP